MADRQSLFIIPESTFKTEDIIKLEGKRLIIFRKKDDTSTAIDEMLNKMMSAINIDIDKDVAFFDLENKQDHINANQWISRTNNRSALVFGIDPGHIGLNIKHAAYLPLKVYETTLLFCHSLHTVHLDINLKKRLWKALQDIFHQI